MRTRAVAARNWRSGRWRPHDLRSYCRSVPGERWHFIRRGHGDLHVIAGVAVPTKLTKEQKHLLEELSKTLPTPDIDPDRQDSGDKPFFERVKDIFG